MNAHRAIAVTSYVGPSDPVRRLTVLAHVGLSGISDADWEADGTTVGPLVQCLALSAASTWRCKKWAIVVLDVEDPNGSAAKVPFCGSHFVRHRNGHDVATWADA